MPNAFHRGVAARRLDVPSRAADLGFTVELPGDWQPHDLPDDDLNFEDPTHLVSLVVVTAPQAAIVFSAAARPAYADGTVSDWGRYLLDHNGLVPSTQGGGSMGSLPALLGEATQASERGDLCVRYAFAEDGGRLISLTLTAPVLVADALFGVWQHILSTFALTAPKGPTVSVWLLASDSASAVNADLAECSEPPLEPLANHALSDDAASFDPEHPTLQRLRDSGIGLAPRLHSVDAGARSVTLACGAIMACIDAPFGWHAIDDGRRVLVFEPTSQVQLNFSLLERPEGGIERLIDELEAQGRSDYPAPEFLRLAFGRVQVLAVRNIADRGEPIEQLHLLVDGPAPDQVLRARITSTPERTGAAGNLGVSMLHSVAFGSTGSAASATPSTADTGPAWWQQAVALERADQLHEAEQAIIRAVDHLGAYISVAEMYRQRMTRLREAGDKAGAQHARQLAADWARSYAAGATSGGEGAALSMERDRFIADLGPEWDD